MPTALFVGAGSAIARAMMQNMQKQDPERKIIALSRQSPILAEVANLNLTHHLTDYSTASLTAIAEELKGTDIDRLVCCVGTLHDDVVFPEKRLTEMTPETLQHYFSINTVIPAMVLKAFVPILDRKATGVLAFLSAQIGSIEDNRLGGWYGYRASKAALNMLIKTTSIEMKRTHKQYSLIAMHPGTTDSPLSEPFQARISAERLYSPQLTAERLLKIIDQVTPEETGQLYHWDGSVLPW